jgi:hypothetical protein
MTVRKYDTVAIQYDEWLNLAKTCRSNNDFTNYVMAQLVDSNATQHKVTLLLDYKTAMMSHVSGRNTFETQKYIVFTQTRNLQKRYLQKVLNQQV